MTGSITYKVGDATQPDARPAVIAHICNDVGGWGAGFVLAISKRWKAPEAAYREWYARGEGFELGAVQLVEVEPGLYVANMIAQRDIRSHGGVPPIRYEALHRALDALDEMVAPETTVHMPRIGCGLAGGSWDEVSTIIDETLVAAGREVVVYDFG